MSSMLRSLVVSISLLGASALASGCCAGKENAAASAKCAHGGKNAESCKACCKSITGKESHSYSPGGCKCY
ncbi:MAG: hypothetical protein MUF64_13415 [Polyangiaceae bacterium]|nr:hypothetical protein [Polyangiaceae bacterium]